MPDLIGENISDNKIDAETKVNKSTEQAIYFFSTLQNLRTQQLEERRTSRNPIKKIRTKMSSQSSLTSSGTSHVRTNSHSSVGKVNPCRIHSYVSLVDLANTSQRSLNSMYSIDGPDDDKTVDTSGTQGSRSSRASCSKSSLWG